MNVWKVFADPVTFFRQKVDSCSTNLLVPCVIVFGVTLGFLAIGICFQEMIVSTIDRAIGQNLYFSPTQIEDFARQLRFSDSLGLIAFGFSSFYIVARWLLSSAIFANCAVLMNREYKFREIAHLSGYCAIVYFPFLVMAAAIVLFYPPHLDWGAIVTSRSDIDLQAAMAEITQQIRYSLPIVLLRNFSWLFLGWSGFLQGLAFYHLFRVKAHQAGVAVITAVAFVDAGPLLAWHFFSPP